MSTTIASYYTDELENWNETISFYNEEMDEMEKKLGQVIERNNIVGIAAKVEAHQNMLNQVSDKFYRIQIEIQNQEAALKTNSTLIEDAAINESIEKPQAKIREQMQATENEYIQAKFNCYNFLAGIFKK